MRSGLFNWRQVVGISLIIFLPVSLFAQESAAAMLRSNGAGVLVNKNAAPATTALYRDDVIETQKQGSARIESTGSSADINPETMVEFQGDELVLDHGSLSVNTNRGLRVRVGCLTVTPVNPADWTHYEVLDTDGKVTVSARKKDVYIDAKSRNLQQAKQDTKSDRSIVRETEQKTRDEHCAAADTSHMTGTALPILSSPWAVGAGAAVVGAGIIWVLKHNDDPISPATP
jgi:hypothetical protein